MNIETFFAIDFQVVGWAAERGILRHATPRDQHVKMGEEFGEIAEAILAGSVSGLRDAIGDTLIALILLARMSGLDPMRDCYASWEADGECGREELKLQAAFGEVSAALARGEKERLAVAIGTMLGRIERLAEAYGMDPTACLTGAWLEIVDRRGEMKNGIFVKDDEVLRG